jgi:hypothetical protein
MSGTIGSAMKKQSSSEVSVQADSGSKIERLREVARRARWDATQGAPHLRSGRFKPEASVEPAQEADLRADAPDAAQQGVAADGPGGYAPGDRS